jgi:hypothetical protein
VLVGGSPNVDLAGWKHLVAAIVTSGWANVTLDFVRLAAVAGYVGFSSVDETTRSNPSGSVDVSTDAGAAEHAGVRTASAHGDGE